MAAILLAMFIPTFAFQFFLPLLCHAENHQSKPDVVDAFKALAAFPYAVAMADNDDSGDLNCMTAVRTKFSKKPPVFVYASFMKGRKGDNRTITYHIKPGPTIDTTEFTVDDDYDHTSQAHYLFSDYKNCIIMELPIYGKQECVLWTRAKKADNVPAICKEQLQEKCKNAVISYDENTCGPLSL
uniref:Lipocalin n=1 Tax=Rhipicephalus appendiculatus TaxID=34631 RepID=A0A131YQF8_RHIAP